MMKKHILILFIALLSISFTSCKKTEDQNTDLTPTWITGKWQMTASYRDTLINTHAVNTAAYLDQLTFKDDNTVASRGANASFTYSLDNMTINESGVIFKIKKLSEVEMTLTNKGTYVNTCQLFKKL